MITNKKKISIVIPIYNEEKNVALLFARLTAILELVNSYSYEIIFVNDGSKDNSWFALKTLAQKYAYVKALNFNRNFGHQIALTAGYHSATGDAIISMDGDLQHPPEMIPFMIDAWEHGYDIVYVQNIHRKDTILKKITAWGFYKFLGMITDVKMPRNVADFRLIDKKVAVFINQSQEKSRYLRGLVAWSGFKHTCIPCTFEKRVSGTTGYTWNKMLKLALDGITGFSNHPFKFFAYSGFCIMITGLVIMSRWFLLFCINSSRCSLFTFLSIISYILLGIQMLLIWLLGEYITMLYEYSKNRPEYVIAEKINCI